jgi:hypothetical protein
VKQFFFFCSLDTNAPALADVLVKAAQFLLAEVAHQIDIILSLLGRRRVALSRRRGVLSQGSFDQL